MFYVNLYQALRFNVQWKLVVKVPNCCLPSGQQKGQLELRGKQKHKGPLRKKKKKNFKMMEIWHPKCWHQIDVNKSFPNSRSTPKNSVLELHSPQCGLFFLKDKNECRPQCDPENAPNTQKEVFKMQTLDPPQTHENEAWFCSSSIRSNGFHWLRWLLQPSEDAAVGSVWFWLVRVGEKPPWNIDLKNMSSAIAHGDLFCPGHAWFHNCWHFGHSIYFMSLCFMPYRWF